VYPLAKCREVQAWADIRNDADHGRFGKVEPDEVKRMIDGIGDFVAKHLG